MNVINSLRDTRRPDRCRAVNKGGYLPAHSPDLNPIELLFSRLKRLPRSAAARTLDTPRDTLGACLERFPPQECRAYIRHSGYGHSE